MIVIKGIIILIIMVILPLLTGDCVCKITKLSPSKQLLEKTILAWVMGNVFMWAVFQIIAVPCILLKQSFILVVVLWSVIMLIVAGFDVFANIMFGKKRFIRELKRSLSTSFDFNNINKDKIWLIAVCAAAIFIVGFQMYKYTCYQHLDEDDSRFVVNAVEAYDNNVMLINNPATGEYEGTWIGELAKDVVSPWMIYVAMISKLIMIHPTIVAHTILPVFLVAIAYSIYYLLGLRLFKNDKASACLMVIMSSFINIYGNYSVYNSSTFLLTRVWQGKAVVAGIMLPLLLFLIIDNYTKRINLGNYIAIGIGNFAICLMSGMGIFFGAIITLTFITCYSIFKKDRRIAVLGLSTCMPNVIYGFMYILIK